MKKLLLLIMFFILTPVFIFSQSLQNYVQEVRGDTLVLKDDIDFGESNTLPLAIEADINPPAGRVYMLHSDGYYSMKNYTTPSWKNLVIIGENCSSVKTNKREETPPILCGAVWEGGISTGRMSFDGILEVKNCIIELGNSNGDMGWNWFSGVFSSKVIVDNCIMEHTLWTVFLNAPNGKTTIKNSYFVNLNGFHNHRNGGVLDNMFDSDSLLVENCTHINAQGFVYQFRDYKINSVVFNHNTFINCPGYVFMNVGSQGNMSVTNNVFINCNIEGYSSTLREADTGQSDPDDSPMGFVNVNPSDAHFNNLGRHFYVDRNLFYWDPVFNDYISTLNTNVVNGVTDWVSNMITMNSRTQAAFDDDNTFPYLSEGTWLKGLPNFAETKNLFTDQLTAVKEYALIAVDVNNESPMASWRLVNDEKDKFTHCDWPIQIDLSYDDNELLNAGFNGFPVGDLNWFPSQYTSWLAQSKHEYTKIHHVLEEGDISYLGNRKYLNVIFPNGGEYLGNDQNQNIEWSYSSIDSVKIEYSTDSGNNWTLIVSGIPADSEHYSWMLPSLNSTRYKIRISDAANKFLNDESDNVFTIHKVLLLDTPIGGEEWEVNSIQEISWTKEIAGNIGIDLSTDNGTNWIPIIQSVSADSGYYYFMVPNTPSKNCKIRIYDLAHENIVDESKNAFTIFEKKLSLTNPNGGEILIGGREYDITWQSEYLDKVKIEFTSDSGNTWISLADSASASDQIYSMKVPEVNSTNCKIKITDLENSKVIAESEEKFSIFIPTISIINPNGGEIWVGDEIQEIKWQSNLVDNIKIEYSTDDGTVWNNIIGSLAANSQGYYWKIPDLNFSSCKVKISDTEYPVTFDESDTSFTIEHAVGIEENEIPTQYALLQNYPNPFNPTTVISYDLPENTFVNLRVFDITGKEVAEIVNSEKSAGKYRVEFDASKLSSGIYFYSITTNSFTKTCKMILMK